jgi:hypothetical protein
MSLPLTYSSSKLCHASALQARSDLLKRWSASTASAFGKVLEKGLPTKKSSNQHDLNYTR